MEKLFSSDQAVLALPEAEQTDVLTLDDWHQESQLSVTALNFSYEDATQEAIQSLQFSVDGRKRLELSGRVVLVSQR